jgi:hypothetical protein
MLDTSSSDNNPTGIVLHAHQAIEDTQPQELLLTETPESTSTDLLSGLHQNGRETTRELPRIDTVPDTRNQLSTTEVSLHALSGLCQLIRKPDGSSSDTKETTTAHHAHSHIEDMPPPEHHTKTLKSMYIESSDGEHQPTLGKNGIRELPTRDTVPDIESHPTATEPLRLVVSGSNQLMTKPNGSSSENNPTGIAHHAHTPTMDTAPPEPHTITQESSYTESSTGDHQYTHGARNTTSLLEEDSAEATTELTTSSDPLKLVLTGSEWSDHTLDTSTTDINPTGIAHHAHHHTEVTQLQELLRTETPESPSIISDHGEPLDG